MSLEKHLTIKEALNEKEKLENQLKLYLNKKDINYYKTQPKACTFDKVFIESSMTLFDRFLKYVEKNSDVNDKLYSLMASINAYDKYIIDEVQRISKIDPAKIKAYQLREDDEFLKNNKRKRTWIEIGEILYCSDRQAHRMYDDVVKGKI